MAIAQQPQGRWEPYKLAYLFQNLKTFSKANIVCTKKKKKQLAVLSINLIDLNLKS